MLMRRIWLVAAVAVSTMLAGAALLMHQQRLPPVAEQATRKGAFVFTDWDGPGLPVFYQLPDKVTPDTPVVFIMHGVNRDADRYRDEWAALARQYGFIAIVPQFGKADFPGSRGYNTGFFNEADGTARPRSRWSFAAIEPLFDVVRQRFGTKAERYSIYGHSAGAQFVHRFILFMPEARVAQAVAANAGWYTMPDRSTRFPTDWAGLPLMRRCSWQRLANR